ncbi:MAG: type IV secretory system conjugative DNA transfer family protein [Acidobacteriota bacterium]
MATTSQPRLEHQSEEFERNLILAGTAIFALALWVGGAFEVTPYLHAARGTKPFFLGRLLAWDHNVLIKLVINPFLAHPVPFLLGSCALALSPLVYGAANGIRHERYTLALRVLSDLLLAGLAFLIPAYLLPGRLAPFSVAWWRATLLAGTSGLLFLLEAIRVSHARLSTEDILRNPHAYDLMDLSGAARLSELKRAGLLVKTSSWPSPEAKALRGRICIGRLYDDGSPTGYFVAPEIAKLQQTVVVAPTGSGKTTSLALPWSRELPRKGQSVFVLDFKGDMAQPIRLGLAGLNPPPLWVFNPLSHASVRWNPLLEPEAGSEDYHEGLEAIAEALFGEVNAGSYQYFDLLDLRMLKAGVRVVGHLEAPSLKALHDLFLSKQVLEETLDHIKDKADLDEFARIEADLKASTDSKKYTFTERIQGVRNKLDAFAHPAIRRVTGEEPDFRLSRLFEQPSCLVFTAPMRMGLAGETLAAMAVRLLQHQLHRRYGHKGGRLFLILDEFSKLAMDHKQTERFISVSRSAGAVSVIILQDMDQLHPATRSSIWGNCQDRYILRGASARTAGWLSDSLGERRLWTRTVSATTSRGPRHVSDAGSLSAREDFVPVLRPREITLTGGLERGAWLQLSKYSHKPILVDLTRPL